MERLGEGIRTVRQKVATHRRVIAHDQVVRTGIEHFLERSTLDMEMLAERLAVSRATLYRVAGSRDELLGEVLRKLTEMMLRDARKARTLPGIGGVVEVSRHFGEQLRSPIMKLFLERDPEAAARLLFTPAGAVHESAVAAQTEIFAETGVTATLRPDVEVAQLAYLYVRTVGAFLYSEFYTGRPVNFDDVVPALHSLLIANQANQA
ncbi:MAG: QsdR family transcriptional regulator [Actinoplanes sp.]